MSRRRPDLRLGNARVGPRPPDEERIGWRWLAAIVVVAALLRVIHVVSIARLFCFEHPQTEGTEYLGWAREILSGHPRPPPFDEGSGYPYWLATVGALLGEGPGPIAGAQVVLGVATCLLVALVAARLSGARRVGIIAGFAAAACGPLISATGEIAPTTLFLFVLAAALYASARSESGRLSAAAERWWAAAAVLWACAIAIRSEAVLAAPIAIWDAARRSGRRAATVVAAGFVLPVALSLAVNASSGHVVPLTYGGGLNFFLGNNSGSDGVDPFQSRTASPTISAAMAAAADDPVRADRRLWLAGLSFWRDAPGAALRLAGKKALWTFQDRELPNTTDPSWWQGKSALFAAPLGPLGFGAYLVASFFGLAALARSDRRSRFACLLAPLAIGLVTCAVFFTNGRFRAPILLPVLVMAAVGLDSLARPTARRERIAACAAAALGGLLAFGGWGGVRRYHLGAIDVNLGVCERADGHANAAVALLSRGLERDPTDGLGWMHLALALDDTGRRVDAIAVFQAHQDALASVDPRLKKSFANRVHLAPDQERPPETGAAPQQ
jgi:hypothetical protein